MKKVSSILFAAILFASCQEQANNNQETTLEVQEEVIGDDQANADGNVLGIAFEPSGLISADQLEGKLGTLDSMQDLTVSGTVASVCQMKGCWMTIKREGGEDVRVTFKDYDSIVMPKDASGKTVVMHGKVKKKEVSVETLRHYAEDAGATAEEIAAITEASETLAFVADGVVIK